MAQRILLAFLFVLLGVPFLFAQTSGEKIDTTLVAKFKDEQTNRSQVMDILSSLTDVYGPRLTGSPAYDRAAAWVENQLKSWGMENVHREYWGPFGKGWTLKRYTASVLANENFPLLSYPKAWSPAVHGTGDVVYLQAKSDSELALFKGKLHNKFVLFDEPRDVKLHTDPEASRTADSSLLKMANAAPFDGGRFRRGMFGGNDPARALMQYKKWQMCEKEGALAVLSAAPGDFGTIFVQQATVPAHPDTAFSRRVSSYQKNAPKILPQVGVDIEHYNRLVRMIQKGEHPKIEMDLEVATNPADSTFNIIAEIPGTDLKDEVVMIGAHFDSWHAGTGATDNATGSSVCLETVRMIKALGLKPRRTIRIALWGGEEQGLLGSAAYVKRHFGERTSAPGDSNVTVSLKPEADKFSVYFNHDNGSGKVRGVYMQGNESTRPIFRSWLAPFRDMGASTLTISNTGGTDHGSFDNVGLPGFQFIQDQLEYSTRTHHSNMDVYERVQSDDLKQGTMIMASFAYTAAMRDAKFPRKPLPGAGR